MRMSVVWYLRVRMAMSLSVHINILVSIVSVVLSAWWATLT